MRRVDSRPLALTVLQALPALGEGGVERGTLEIAEHLIREGHRSMVVSAGGHLVEDLVAQGSEHIEWSIGRKSPFSLRWIPRLRRMLERERIDLVHARSRFPAWITWLALRGIPPHRRPRWVTTVHGFYSVNPYSAIMTRGERVIAVSRAIRDYIEQSYRNVDVSRIQVIHRGVDPERFPYKFEPAPHWRVAWSQRYPELGQQFVIVIAGRLSRIKGHEDFLYVLAHLAKSGLPVHGLVVGNDQRKSDYVSALKQTVRDRSLPITFCGFRSDITEIYASADLVLSLSSKPESFGRSVLEPLSLGVPVIGYDQGGVGEILQTMFPEGRVAPGDVAAVTAKAREFIENPPQVRHENPYPLHLMQEQTLALYQELCGEV